MRIVLCCILASFFCSGCYRMPQEDEVSTLPITNNPTITKTQNNSLFMPPLSR